MTFGCDPLDNDCCMSGLRWKKSKASIAKRIRLRIKYPAPTVVDINPGIGMHPHFTFSPEKYETAVMNVNTVSINNAIAVIRCSCHLSKNKTPSASSIHGTMKAIAVAKRCGIHPYDKMDTRKASMSMNLNRAERRNIVPKKAGSNCEISLWFTMS